MNQPYFIVVLAHSLHGKIRRFHVSQKVAIAVLALAVLGCFTLFGMVSSYLRMAWKVSNYNDLRAEAEFLKARYQKLLTESNETTEQMARLQLFASEVSMAYGLAKKTQNPSSGLAPSETLVPTMSETLEQYNLLKSANLATFSRSLSRRWLVNVMPSIWPINGRLQSYFGNREDPFNGHQAFHAGLDITAPTGTPIHATADGIVKSAGWYGGYGKLVVVDHGNGVETYYAHMSRVDVIPGQEVRMGQTVGGVGSTGRVTAPHLHYEVRRFGSPQNPWRYMQRPAMASLTGGSTKRDFGF